MWYYVPEIMTQIVKRATWKQKHKIMEQSLETRLKCPVGALYLKDGQTEEQAKAQRNRKLRSTFRSANKAAFAANMRRHMTSAEKVLWKVLRGDRRWKAQQIIGGYIPDFVCEQTRTIIEVDGPIHDNQRAQDRARDGHLNAKGYKVLRFTNRQVKDSLGEVMRKINNSTKPGEQGSRLQT